MAEYIEREAAINFVKEKMTKVKEAAGVGDAVSGVYGMAIRHSVDYLSVIPAADVVEVVRCKDCVFYNTEYHFKGEGWCKNNYYTATDDHFCSYGERKED